MREFGVGKMRRPRVGLPCVVRGNFPDFAHHFPNFPNYLGAHWRRRKFLIEPVFIELLRVSSAAGNIPRAKVPGTHLCFIIEILSRACLGFFSPPRPTEQTDWRNRSFPFFHSLALPSPTMSPFQCQLLTLQLSKQSK